MKNIFYTLAFLVFSVGIYAQEDFQEFPDFDLRIECNCDFIHDGRFVASEYRRGLTNILGAYTCIENGNRAEIAVKYEFAVYDETKRLTEISLETDSDPEFQYLDEFAESLHSRRVKFKYTEFRDMPAISYYYEQRNIPTMAVVFVRENKAYLVKVGTFRHLERKFEEFLRGMKWGE